MTEQAEAQDGRAKVRPPGGPAQGIVNGGAGARQDGGGRNRAARRSVPGA